MPRMRILKPEFWSDHKILELSFMERLLFMGIWNFVSDSGVMEYSFKSIKAQIFPSDDLKLEELELGLQKLNNLGLIILYHDTQNNYLQVMNWHKHQTINRPTPSHIPLYNKDLHHSGSTHGVIIEGSLKTHAEVKLSKVKLREVKEEVHVASKTRDLPISSDPDIQLLPEIVKKSTKPKKKKPDPIYIEHAEKLLVKMQAKYKGSPRKVTPAQIENWADDIRKLVEHKGFSFEEIIKVEDWVFSDSCPMPYVIQSGRSFYSKFEKILPNMNNNGFKSTKNNHGMVPFSGPSGRVN